MLRINEVVKYMTSRYRILDVEDDVYTWINIDSDKAFLKESLKPRLKLKFYLKT